MAEDDIVAAHRDRFYFEKVEAENSYNQEAGISDRMNLAKEDLKINIIYVKDGQDYFSFRSDCAQQTGCKVEDTASVWVDFLRKLHPIHGIQRRTAIIHSLIVVEVRNEGPRFVLQLGKETGAAGRDLQILHRVILAGVLYLSRIDMALLLCRPLVGR